MGDESRYQERLATPVLLAALASVPAVFLTLFDDPYATIGLIVNWLSGAVLVCETLVLLAVSTNKLTWLKENWLLVALTLAVVIGVVFAIGPVQLLRFARVFGALRIVRTGRIVKAVRIIRESDEFDSRSANIVSIVVGTLAVVFVGVVLADPSSTARHLIDRWVSPVMAVGLIIMAGLIIAAATFIVAYAKDRPRK